MRFLPRYLVFLVVALAAAGGFSGRAGAHPHSFIDITTTVVLSAPGSVAAIRQTWVFDETYSGSIVRERGASPSALNAFAAGALVNLAPYRYFTHLAAGGRAVAVAPPTAPDAVLRGNRLAFTFELPLRNALNVRSENLTLSVYDPTYYIEMLHSGAASIAFAGPSAETCGAKIVAPTPSEETRRRAFDMDRQATPDHTLGEKFAERVEIACR